VAELLLCSLGALSPVQFERNLAGSISERPKADSAMQDTVLH
jgi:hypothetical protein